MKAILTTNTQQLVPITRAKLSMRWQDGAFVVVLLLGLFLRLWQLEGDQFLMDSAGTAMLARAVVDLHGLPVTGINSSIGSFTPPAPVYIYMLPVLLGGPIGGMLFTVIICVAAIAVTYLLCRRYLNATIGLIAALLFAMTWGPVTYSRFIWQPSLQIPLVVWLVALLVWAVGGRGKGWLAWALPVWGLLLQAHPVTASLSPLLLAAWFLAPETVRRRDVVIGVAALAALFVPTAVFELTSHFFDLLAYRRLLGAPSTITGTVFRQFFVASGLPQESPWAGTSGYRILTLLWDGVLVTGLFYMALRVLLPLRGVVLPARAASSQLALGRTIVNWVRAPEQARWRVDFVLLAWPSLILLAQVRHSSPVVIHYVLATCPAQFIAVGVLLYDVALAAQRVRWRPHLPGFAAIAISAALVGTVCFVQVAGVLYSYRLESPQSLRAEEADLSAVQVLAQRDSVGLVVFQPSYFDLEPVRYLLATQYHFATPTEIVESGACLPGLQTADTLVLYVMGGPMSEWESILRAIPGVHDLLAATPEGGIFRAYLVAPVRLGVTYGFPNAPNIDHIASFGDSVAAERAGSVSVPGEPAEALALEARVLRSPTSAPFHSFYGFRASLTSANGQLTGNGAMPCDIAPWTPGQLVYYLLPGMFAAGLHSGDRVTLSAYQMSYDEQDPTIGSLRLVTALDMVTRHYTVPVTSDRPLAPGACADVVLCSVAGGATFTVRS